MRTSTLERALQMAAAYRQLRDAEIEDARRWVDVLRRLNQPGPQLVTAIYEHIRGYARSAREWNQQLVIAERAVRQCLTTRRTQPVAARFSERRAVQ